MSRTQIRNNRSICHKRSANFHISVRSFRQSARVWSVRLLQGCRRREWDLSAGDDGTRCRTRHRHRLWPLLQEPCLPQQYMWVLHYCTLCRKYLKRVTNPSFGILWVLQERNADYTYNCAATSNHWPLRTDINYVLNAAFQFETNFH